MKPTYKIVDEHKEFTFKNFCPYCGANLTYRAEGWRKDENNELWIADMFDVRCHNEPKSISSKEWDDWFKNHSAMPYEKQLPVNTKVENWIAMRYRFNLLKK